MVDTGPQQQSSWLLRLPGELRNHIYSDVLLSSESVLICAPDSRPGWKPPALLQTCRTIRREASSIYFSGNAFAIQGWQSSCFILPKWLAVLDRGTRVGQVYVDDNLYPPPEVVPRLLALHRALQSRHAGIRQDMLFVEVMWNENWKDTSWVNLPWMLANHPEHGPDFEDREYDEIPGKDEVH